jgi:hypothetical protein
VKDRHDLTAFEDLALLVDELTVQVTTRERIRRRERGKWTSREHTTRAAGLLTLLDRAAGRLGSAAYGDGGHTKPSSRTPTGSVYVEELARITTAAFALRQTLARAQGHAWRAGGNPVEACRDILQLAQTAKGRDVEAAVRTVYSWTAAARVLLSYQVPAIELRVSCSECGGTLKVRRDASSDVWCVGGYWTRIPWPASGCGSRWSRLFWIELAAQERYLWTRPEVEEEAWAAHAVWLRERAAAHA